MGKKKICSKQELLLWFTLKRAAFNMWVLLPTNVQMGLLAQRFIGTFEFIPFVNQLRLIPLEETDWRTMGKLSCNVDLKQQAKIVIQSCACKKKLLTEESYTALGENYDLQTIQKLLGEINNRTKAHLTTIMKVMNTMVRETAPIVFAKFQKKHTSFSTKVADERRMLKLINNFRRNGGNISSDTPASFPEIHLISTSTLTEEEEADIADGLFPDGEEAELNNKLEMCFPMKKKGGKFDVNPLAIQADAELSTFYRNKNYLEKVLDGYSSIQVTAMAAKAKHSRQHDLRRVNNKIVATLNQTKSQLEKLMLEAETAINAIVAADASARTTKEYACNLLNYDLSYEMKKLLYPETEH